jgi:AcrR family transcriptional regulator
MTITVIFRMMDRRADDLNGTRSTRPYRSTLREQRAEETRARIISAARGLFAARGFAGTTVALIAEHAGVAQPTVYAVFGTKDGIMAELLGRLEGEAEAQGWRARIADEPDPAQKLALYARWHRALFAAGRDVIAPALAAGSDPAAVELRAQGHRSAHEWLDPILDALESAGALAPGLDHEQAVARAWMVTGPDLYFRATDSCGWSDDDYERWLTALLCSQLLCPAPSVAEQLAPSSPDDVTDHPTDR